MNSIEFIEQSPEIKPFWDAAAVGRFMLPWCRQCHKTHWYPRAICPHCVSMEIDWRESEGEGEIHSFSVNRRGKEPYVLAYIALAEGPIMLSNVVNGDLAALSIGKKVKVVFEHPAGQAPVPLFALR